MHIPDRILEPAVWAPLAAVSAASIAVCARRAQARLAERSIPLVGVLGAFVFALQMINFPVAAVAGGVSDHVVGAGILVIAFGPSIAVLAMSAIIVIQALLFADGGITALGANVFDMGVLPVLVAYGLYRLLARVQGDLAAAAATLAGVMAGALGASAWIMLSQPYGARFLAAMMLMHLVSGGVEAAVTVAVLRALGRRRLLAPVPGARNA